MTRRLLVGALTWLWRQTVGAFVAAAYAAYSQDRRDVGANLSD